jgi:RHS repeat-associated protein
MSLFKTRLHLICASACVLALVWAWMASSRVSAASATSLPSLVTSGNCGRPVCTWLPFGPEAYTRGTGDPVTVSSTFSILNPGSQYTLHVDNSGVSSAVISLNGVQVLGPSDFNANVTTIDKAVSLQLNNELDVQLRSAPGSSLMISIIGVDNDPPVISASAAPAANAFGWNKGNVVVSFTCSDQTSGVASCPGPVTVSTEAANQVISGTAIDRAGNTASTSVTINLDRTPPMAVASVSPQPNAAGWNKTDVSVSFLCSDSLSGVATCPTSQTVTSEGANQAISGTATDIAGNSATTTVTIKLDKTPPVISIASPANNSVSASSTLQITGTTMDALSGVANTTCNGSAAVFQGTSFNCSVNLGPGANTITVIATDVAGNSSSQSLTVNLGPVITDFNPKSASVGTLISVSGSGFASGSGGPQVALNSQGGGTIAAPLASFTATSINFIIPAGAASGPITVSTAGIPGISAASLGVVASSGFSLSASPVSANVQQGTSGSISVSLSSSNGFSQLADLSVSGLPSGMTASFSPVRITAGQFSILTVAAPAGQPLGSANLTISAAATVEGIPTTQSASMNLNVQAPTTSLIGRIVESDNIETPIPGIIATFLGVDDAGHKTGCSGQTQSDAAGNFAFTNLSSACLGRQLVGYDGNSATDGEKYAGVNLAYTMIAGQITGPELVHLPAISDAETIMVKQNATVDQVFSYSTIPGITVTVYAGTTLTLPNGTKPDPFPMAAVLVPVDRLPDTPPPTTGTLRASIVAFQPADTTSNQPVSVTFPNVVNTAPGVNMELDTLDPIVGELVKYGTGTVSADGTKIVPDADPAHPGHRFGISHFDWHGPMTPAGNATNPCPSKPCANAGDPVDLSSGLLVVSQTDLAFGSARGQVSIQRTYRTLAGRAGAFGIGTDHNYGYLLDTTSFLRGNGTFVTLITPDGNQFTFAQQGTNTFVNSTNPTFLGAVMTGPTNGAFVLRFKNGTIFGFQLARPPQVFLTSITDANGNITTLVRGNSTQPSQITQIIDPVGRTLNLTYDNFNRVLSLTDPIGRTVQYTYNSQGTLATVTDPAGGVTTYGYDGQNRMTSITDARQITYLQNSYDDNGRVIQQTAADGGITKFGYTLLNPTVPTSPVLLTVVTDPLGNQTIYHFNPQGYLLDMTDALGQQVIYTRDPGTNQLLGVQDPLGRTTSFTYDSAGNLLTVMRLANTSHPVAISTTYDPLFNRPTSVTDSLGHITSFKYDPAGNLLSIIDPLGNKATLAYDTQGELATSSDALGNVTSYAYLNGNLVGVTDPLGRTISRTTDAVGRVLTITDPIGEVTSYQYNALNQKTQINDAAGRQTKFAYDGNGNLLSIIDANQNTISYAFDSMDRVVAYTDPLKHTENYVYDKRGSLSQFIDRRGNITKYSYDAVGNKTSTAFGNESSIHYAYDAGGRLTQINDSVNGIILHSYDELDRLIQEVSPEGTVSYTYDSAGRRATMAASGQPTVQYSYDDDARVTEIAQGISNVGFAYDGDGRYTTLTLPNGITASYTYDAGSELTVINYSLGGKSLGALVYSYDTAGRRTSVGGSFARSSLPSAVTAASYNAANQLITWGATTLAYDASGNLMSDGSNTYTWDARDQLTSIGGPASAAFQYDSFGRRVSKTIGSTTVQYLYDGPNFIQESSSGVSAANLLAGLHTDQYFQRTDSTGSASFLRDALGSTLALTDSNGAIQTQYTFDPFGATTSSGASSTNPLQYTARENDSTGLYFYRARYYSPQFGRFISQDPLGVAGSGPNLYSYAGDNPISNSDPSGLYWPGEHKRITFYAAFENGYMGEEALALEDAVAAVDDRIGTQEADAYNSNTHAMAGRKKGRYQSCGEAYRGTQNQILEDIAKNDLAKALHTIQDSYSPAHFGYQSWDGGWSQCIPGTSFCLAHVPSVGHLWGDYQFFDSNANVQAAIAASAQFISYWNDHVYYDSPADPREYLAPNPCPPGKK